MAHEGYLPRISGHSRGDSFSLLVREGFCRFFVVQGLGYHHVMTAMSELVGQRLARRRRAQRAWNENK